MTDPAADCAPPDRSTRRALLGAGVLGATLALAGSRPAAAQPSSGLSDGDRALVGAAIGVELAARDLYDEAIAAGAGDELWWVLREQHEAYAQRLSGIAGLSANTRDDATFDARRGAFQTSDPAEAAFELEGATAATHLELLREVVHAEPAGAIASIAAMESRQAAVTGRLAGQSDGAVLVNEASPIEVAS